MDQNGYGDNFTQSENSRWQKKTLSLVTEMNTVYKMPRYHNKKHTYIDIYKHK